jgi:hypothetical protein
LSLLAACRGDSGGTNNPAPDGSVDMPKAIHIQDVQSDSMPPGTLFDLHGVVVTAVDGFGTRTGDFWVEEPGGGPFSGVHVFGAPTTQVANIKAGDIVDITGGSKSEFAISSDTSGRTVTEVQAPKGGMLTVTKSGVGTIPAPAVVDALVIGQKATQAARDAEWEKWEGVLITLNHVSALGAPQCITSAGNCTDATFQSFSITGVAKAESSLVAFPTPTVKPGDCFASMTGVVDYVFDYLIYPRSADDMVTGGTGCPPREIQNLCADGVDNDGNGFGDCMDFGCEVGPDAWLGTSCTPADATCGCSANLAAGASANKVNTGTTGPVLMHSMYVTAVGPKGFWVADATTAVQNGGVFVFLNVAPTVAIGQQLDQVQGLSGPFNGSKAAGSKSVIQISNPTTGNAVTSGATFTPISNATAATLADLTAGAPFAGSLVQLQFLKVKTVTAHQVTLADNSNTTIMMADGALASFGGTTPAVGDCYSSLTGVMDFNTFNNPQVRTINPTTASDIVKGTGCTAN